MHVVDSIDKHVILHHTLVQLAKLIKLSLFVEVLHWEVALEALYKLVVLLNKEVPVSKVTATKANSQSFARVSRANSPLRRADHTVVSLSMSFVFIHAVCLNLNLRHQVGTSRDLESSQVFHAVIIKLGQLIEHAWNVDNASIAEDVHAAWVHDSAGKQVESVLHTIHDDRVPSVGTTVEASTHIEVLSKDIDELAFAFITPLSSQNDSETGLESSGTQGTLSP